MQATLIPPRSVPATTGEVSRRDEKKRLKPGGEVVMIDFHKKDFPVGQPLQMKLARKDLITQVETNSFLVAKGHTFLPYQYS